MLPAVDPQQCTLSHCAIAASAIIVVPPRRTCADTPRSQGNVEYKLKLTNITPARFARLVTQMKWRLLEGGGQAYYELGVADSGSLIGLSRADCEESLQTLEMMAGEIGASVIVVKEILVPPALAALADKLSEYIDPETGEWTEKMANKRQRRSCGDGDSGPGTPALTEDIFSPDSIDDDEALYTPSTHPVVGPRDIMPLLRSERVPHSNPEQPTAQSSPFIAPLDDDLALFSMEPEPDLSLDSVEVTVTQDLDADILADNTVLDIAISSVFKPRPMHQRYQRPTLTAGLRKVKGRDKKPQPWHVQPQPGPKLPPEPVDPVQKAIQRRITRDKRREERRKAQAESGDGAGQDGPAEVNATAHDPIDAVVDVAPACVDEVAPLMSVVDDELVEGFNRLAVDAASAKTFVDSQAVRTPQIVLPAGELEIVSGVMEVNPHQLPTEPRIIVEALVVRKMSIEEATLDFGGWFTRTP